jgi:WD40 repeat protein
VDARTLQVVRRYRVGNPPGDAAISANGGTLAVEDPGGSLRLLDLHSGRVRTLAGPATGEFGIGALSPDGRTLATWDENDVILWDVRRGLPIERFEGHDREAEVQVFSPDGRTLYTAGEDSRVIVWDVAGDRRLGVPFRTGFVLKTGESFPPPFAISPDGRTLAVARVDGRVDLIDAETLRRTGGFEAFDGRPVLAIEYAPDGGTLAVAGVGGGVGVWDAASETRIGALLRAPRGPVKPTFYTDFGIAPASPGSPVTDEKGLANPHNVQALAFGQGDLLAAAEVGGTVRIWDLGRRELAGPPLRLPPARRDPLGRRRHRGSRRGKRPAARQATRRRRDPDGRLLPRWEPARRRSG